jgi:hypothetical protein
MLFIVLSGIVGAGAMFFALWPYRAFSVFLPTPFFAGLAALWLRRRSADCRRQPTTTSRDEMSERDEARTKVNSPPE